MLLADTHCHLDFPEFDADRADVIRRSEEQGVGLIINIGSSIEGSQRSVDLSRKFKSVYAVIGVHPHEADSVGSDYLKTLRGLVSKEKVVAIGEIGLDYFKNFSSPKNQVPLFTSLLNFAKEFSLPLVVHTRSAQEDTLKILKEAMPVRAVVHCFSGDRDFLEACLNLGFFISFTCNITYKKSADLREIVRVTPLDRLMLETDAPYLSPEGLRGKRNEPMHVKSLADFVAVIKGIKVEEIAAKTTENAVNFFNLK